jgi:hypothetical protein
VDVTEVGGDALEGILRAGREVAGRAQEEGKPLRLMVFPAGMLKDSPSEPLRSQPLLRLAADLRLDLVVGVSEESAGRRYATSVFIGADGQVVKYRRIHRTPGEPVETGDRFIVLDRDYARVGLLQAQDLLAPESTLMMAKMAVDLVAVCADMPSRTTDFLWQVRTWDLLHIVMANRRGPEGIYLGGYHQGVDHSTQEGSVVMELSTADVRDKKDPPRLVDLTPLLVTGAR